MPTNKSKSVPARTTTIVSLPNTTCPDFFRDACFALAHGLV